MRRIYPWYLGLTFVAVSAAAGCSDSGSDVKDFDDVGMAGIGGTGGMAGMGSMAGQGGGIAGSGGMAGQGGGIAGSGGMAGQGGGIAGSGGMAGQGGGIAGSGGMAGQGGQGGTAGSGGQGGSGGDGGQGGQGGDGGAAAVQPPCIEQDSEVVLVGDSYIEWGTHTLPEDLVSESGQDWRNYAVGGSSMASGGLTGFIPDQFENAVNQDPNIKAVVMDGGGNDVLLADTLMFPGSGECKNSADSPNMQVCQDIVDLAQDRAVELMNRMAEAGVEDVIYFFYPYVPEGTALGGANPNAILDYSLPIARENCEGAEERTNGDLRCHFVDMIPVFEGHDEYFAPADIHPNGDGSAAMAEAIWSRMQDECVGQPASAGCCRTE